MLSFIKGIPNIKFGIEGVMHRYFDHFPRNRCNIMDEDWDNLIILDACRYDAFKEVNSIPGTLEYRLSKGSYTGGFFEENFTDSQHHDTIYVTGNPVPKVDEWCSVDVGTVFYDIHDVWKNHWDEDVNTVRPGPVADAIKKVHANHPDKRLLGHFIQPHQPFIGETGQNIEEEGMRAYDKLAEGESEPGKTVWERLKNDELSAEDVWQAYIENLELVLPHVRDLCDDLNGKTVITSDHGNLFGEFAWPFPVRQYGHPPRIHTRKLIKVPWLELESDERRNITSESPEMAESKTDEEERLKRLEHLGYQ